MRELEEKFSTGKQDALKAIGRLETNAREQREESALLLQEQMADHEAKTAALSGEVRIRTPWDLILLVLK